MSTLKVRPVWPVPMEFVMIVFVGSMTFQQAVFGNSFFDDEVFSVVSFANRGMLILLAFLFFILRKKRTRKPRSPIVTDGILLMFVCAYILGQRSVESLYLTNVFRMLFFFYVLPRWSIRDPHSSRFGPTTIGTVLLTIVAVVLLTIAPQNIRGGRLAIAGHSNFTARAIVPAVIWGFVAIQSKSRSFSSWTLILTGITIIVLTGSRQALLSLLILIFGILWFKHPYFEKRVGSSKAESLEKWELPVWLGLSLLGLVSLSFVVSLADGFGFRLLNASSIRLEIFRTYIALFIDQFHMAITKGIHNEVVDGFFSSMDVRYFPSHNAVMGTYVDAGLVAAALFVFLHVQLLITLWQVERRGLIHQTTMPILFLGCLGILLMGMLNNTFIQVSSPDTYLFYVATGTAAAIVRSGVRFRCMNSPRPPMLERNNQ